MLRITLTRSQRRVTLMLEGRLIGPWVDELERAWDLLDRRDGVTVDLARVAFVDQRGKELLKRMTSMGARTAGCGPMMQDIIAACSTAPDSDKNRHEAKNKW